MTGDLELVRKLHAAAKEPMESAARHTPPAVTSATDPVWVWLDADWLKRCNGPFEAPCDMLIEGLVQDGKAYRFFDGLQVRSGETVSLTGEPAFEVS